MTRSGLPGLPPKEGGGLGAPGITKKAEAISFAKPHYTKNSVAKDAARTLLFMTNQRSR
jgi:hypothetical protein